MADGELLRVQRGGRRLRTSSRTSYAEKPFCQACVAAMEEKARQARQFSPFTKIGGAVAGSLLVIGMIGSAFDKKAPTPPPTVVATPAAAPLVPDMAVAVKKPKKKRPKSAVATRAAPADENGVLPMKNDDEPYELVK